MRRRLTTHAPALVPGDTRCPPTFGVIRAVQQRRFWPLYLLAMIRRIAVAFTILLVPSVFAQSQPALAEPDVREALAKFIRAFDDLDWEHFRLAVCVQNKAVLASPHVQELLLLLTA